MDGIMNNIQFAMKRYRDRLKKNKKEQRFYEKRKKQLSQTHTVSQPMYKKRIEKVIRNHELDMQKSRIRKRKQEKSGKRKDKIKQYEIKKDIVRKRNEEKRELKKF